MTSYRQALFALFALFAAVNALYLHRVPGLMGDEASEGQNVYELLEREGITIQGERSYIGPLMDYVRVPFIAAFGYTALALRVPVWLVSLASFLMAASIFRKWFGEWVSLFPLVAIFFSLPYLTEQRLGWAITLLPFFFFLTVWLSQQSWPYKWVFVGLAAGVGLHNHILFAPTLAALMVAGPAVQAIAVRRRPVVALPSGGATRSFLVPFVAAAISFWAGFSTQFVILQLFPEDQGDPMAVAELMSERVDALPSLLPRILSGSSFVARYTGVEFSFLFAQTVTWLVIGLAVIGVALSYRKKVVWVWVVGLAVHLGVLLYMIDRFSLRYFVVFVLGIYMLAGLGIGEIVVRFAHRYGRWPWIVPVKVLGLAVVLILVWTSFVVVPFVRTGGSLNIFSLGNRTDTAAALVDEQPLIACLAGAGGVSSENVHIYNRLQYLSHQYPALTFVPEEQLSEAAWLVHYRGEGSGGEERCPELAHFMVVPQE